MSRSRRMDFSRAVRLVRTVCRIAGDPKLIARTRQNLHRRGVLSAIEAHNNTPIFDWLMEIVSLQGVSDAAALTYMRHHGTVTWDAVSAGLVSPSLCRKLSAFGDLRGCRFHKLRRTCAVPSKFGGCPLPRHDLRNGRLNQAAYSFYLFVRDVAGGDFIGWLDGRVTAAHRSVPPNARPKAAADAVIDPMRAIFGVSNKLLNMAMSDLFLAAGGRRKPWRDAGAAMVTIDTLVHNWLWRTGIIHGMGKPHAYGTGCYRFGGCAELIERFAARIDARTFGPTLPRMFPRFIEHAIWRFCAQSELNTCNGSTVDDRARCTNGGCTLYPRCGRRALAPAITPT